MTPRAPVVPVACGVRLVRRGADVPPVDGQLTVGPVADVALPASVALEVRSPAGDVWRRLWSEPGRLVLEIVGWCVVEVRDEDGVVTFDRRLVPDVEDHILLDHVLPLWLARRGELVLHGAVLARDGTAIVLTGHSGAGKSTLTASLGSQGWRIGGDDAAVVRLGAAVTVVPTYGAVRLTPDAVSLLGMPPRTGVPVAGKRRIDLAGSGLVEEPARLAAVVRLKPEPADRTALLERVRGAAALDLLLTNTFHVDLGSGGLFAEVVDGLARVAESVVVADLLVPRGTEGLAAAGEVLTRSFVATSAGHGP